MNIFAYLAFFGLLALNLASLTLPQAQAYSELSTSSDCQTSYHEEPLAPRDLDQVTFSQSMEVPPMESFLECMNTRKFQSANRYHARAQQDSGISLWKRTEGGPSNPLSASAKKRLLRKGKTMQKAPGQFQSGFTLSPESQGAAANTGHDQSDISVDGIENPKEKEGLDQYSELRNLFRSETNPEFSSDAATSEPEGPADRVQQMIQDPSGAVDYNANTAFQSDESISKSAEILGVFSSTGQSAFEKAAGNWFSSGPHSKITASELGGSSKLLRITSPFADRPVAGNTYLEPSAQVADSEFAGSQIHDKTAAQNSNWPGEENTENVPLDPTEILERTATREPSATKEPMDSFKPATLTMEPNTQQKATPDSAANDPDAFDRPQDNHEPIDDKFSDRVEEKKSSATATHPIKSSLLVLFSVLSGFAVVF